MGQRPQFRGTTWTRTPEGHGGFLDTGVCEKFGSPKYSAHPYQSSNSLQTKPTSIVSLANRQILSVACGKDFTFAVDNTGRVMAWGQNDLGQLAQKSTITLNRETEVVKLLIELSLESVIAICRSLETVPLFLKEDANDSSHRCSQRAA